MSNEPDSSHPVDMNSSTIDELEGRLNAYRELMIDILAAMIGGDTTVTAFVQRLRDDSTFKDGEEDPGVLPETAFAIENAMARETRSIIDAARARADAFKR